MRTFRSRYTGQVVTKERKTAFVTEDVDTIAFMKYYMHNRSKRCIMKDSEYEEMNDFAEVHDIFTAKDSEIVVKKRQ